MKNRLLTSALVLSALVSLGGFSLAQASSLFSVTGSSAKSSDSDMVWVQLGSGYDNTGLRYIYLTLDDRHTATYFTNPVLVECSTNVANPSLCSPTKEITAGESAGGSNYYSVAQTGVGKRVVAFDFHYFCTYTGGSCTFATGTIVMNPAKFYWFRVSSQNSKTGGPAGLNTALYGTTSTIHTIDGTAVIGLGGTTPSQLSGIGTPFFVGTDAYDATLFPVELTPASSSSSSSLSGAKTFCLGVASTSYAFGIPYGLCYISGYLFIPSQDSITQFFGAAEELKTKIPYSYVFELQTLLDSISSSSGTFPSISIASPFRSTNVFDVGGGSCSNSTNPFCQTTSSTSFTLFSLATIQYFGSSLWSVFRVIMSAVLYVSLALVLWRMSVNFFSAK